MNRRQFVHAAVLTVGTLGTVRRAGAAQRVHVTLVSPCTVPCLPLHLARRLGFYEAEGLTVALEVDDRADNTPGAGARVYACTFDALVEAHARAQPRLIFAALTRTPQVAIGWHSDAALRVPAAQRRPGGAVGVLAGDGMARLALAHWWRLNGAASDAVAPVLYATPDALEQDVLSRRVDAVCVGDPLLTRLQRMGVLYLLTDMRDPEHSQRLFGGSVIGVALSAAPAVLAAHQPELQALARAVQRSLRWLQTASPMDLAAHADLFDLAHDRALFLTVLEHARASFVTDVLPQAAAVRRTLRWLYPDVGQHMPTLEPGRWFTARVAPEA
ncbi:ABC transporter substrate-binding protein [Tepidimonas charontis]|uniref:SsuA/THI5-like domain-containing protein n=1 Tax=Tepidimonas charontis TaxID=2267262 RepID=A0A554XGW2_9BURK|nr:ABC transporter substrate-binding protein [Tepidimonas charontis]TSE35061.1 hypothetical protein Tchar_00992 [Tepidimonas charontis]